MQPIPFEAEPPLAGLAPPSPALLGPGLLAVAAGAEFWVFGYGSLMWDPGFPHREAQGALLHGWHRALCVWSHRYRGTPERPGLVLGLKPGGSCRGRAFRVAGADREATLDYLYRREMLSGAYRPLQVRVRLPGGIVPALSFVPDRAHPQFAGGIDEAAALAVIRGACGQRGSCRDYLANTVRQLDALGIAEGALHRLLARVEAGQG